MSKAELGRLLTDLLAKVDSKVNFVYWQVTRGVEPRNHVYEEGDVYKRQVFGDGPRL